MLRELSIHDYKLLRDVNLSFETGMTVLTGETGAGKTQCLEALMAVLGARQGDDSISRDSDKAILGAVFNLADRPDIAKVLHDEGWLDEDENEIVLERTIERDGRSRGRLNGRRVPVGTLQTVGDRIVDLLGQHARADILTRPSLEILDSLGDDTHRGKLESVRKKYAEWQHAKSEYVSEKAAIARASERRELVQFQHAELDKADLKPGEEEKLTREAELLENARERIESAHKAASLLSGEEEDVTSARDFLQESLDLLESTSASDPAIEAELAKLREMVFLTDELSDTLRKHADGIVDDPARRKQVEERLEEIHRLRRKYRTDEAGLVGLRDRLGAELEKVEFATERLKELEREREKTKSEFLGEAEKLSKSRTTLSKRIAKEVKKHLADLDLPHAKFIVEQNSYPDAESEWRSDGIDRVELQISTNPSQEPGPLKKVVSGGELSRLLLALKTVLANRDRVPVLVFDEAEAGIGGETAFRVGEKLTELARSHQLIIVSHLPQIASQANGHWVIEKSGDGGGTKAGARQVSSEDRVEEIGRMLGARGDRKALDKLARSFLDHK